MYPGQGVIVTQYRQLAAGQNNRVCGIADGLPDMQVPVVGELAG